jgi:restriction system protein
LLNLLKQLPPEGFERICQRLLRESGFERVTVTGGPHDRGIDGIGILQINQFLSFKVVFQCKRYAGSVSREEVGTFRNSVLGRADKGIIMTTETFTAAAREEASRDGVLPIELVDGQKLVEMFEKLELGLKPKMTYELDMPFFQEFIEKIIKNSDSNYVWHRNRVAQWGLHARRGVRDNARPSG